MVYGEFYSQQGDAQSEGSTIAVEGHYGHAEVEAHLDGQRLGCDSQVHLFGVLFERCEVSRGIVGLIISIAD